MKRRSEQKNPLSQRRRSSLIRELKLLLYVEERSEKSFAMKRQKTFPFEMKNLGSSRQLVHHEMGNKILFF